MAYRLLSYDTQSGARAGILVDGKVYDVARIAAQDALASVRAVLDHWPAADAILHELAERCSGGDFAELGTELAAVRLLAPVLYPGTIYAAGGNYVDHIEKMFRIMNIAPQPTPKERGERPWHFIKPGRPSVVGPNARIEMPEHSQKVDWEIELAAVIGTAAKGVSVEDALGHVAGYTIANDLSARDNNTRKDTDPSNPFYRDMLGGKGFDGSCPMGPWIVPSRYIADPQDLDVKLWVNEELMQDSNTSRMVFTVADQIAMLSSRITLYPGDVILTGTPAGAGMESQRFLNKGDKVRLAIEGIGELVHWMG